MATTERYGSLPAMQPVGRRPLDLVQLGFLGIVGFTAVLYTSALYHYFFFVGTTSFKPLYFYFITIAMAAVVFVLNMNQTLQRLPKPLITWLWVFSCFVLLSYLLSSQSSTSYDAMVASWQAAALVAAFAIIFVQDGERLLLRRVLLAVVLAAVCINIFDFLVPTFSKVSGRAAGLYHDSNMSGHIIVYGMILTCLAVPRRFRLWFCLFAGVAVLLTFSRSSWIMWAFSFVALGIMNVFTIRSKVGAGLLLGGFALFAAFAFFSGALLDLFVSLGLDGYLTPNTLARLGVEGQVLNDASASSRVQLINVAFGQFQKSPWIGTGIGGTSEWIGHQRPHNLYLLFAVEGGLLGLAVVLGLLVALWWVTDPVGRIAVVAFAFANNFSHTGLEDPKVLCMMVLATVLQRRAATSAATVERRQPRTS